MKSYKSFEAVSKSGGPIYHVHGNMTSDGIRGPYRMQSYVCEGVRHMTDGTNGTHPLGFFSKEQYDFREIENPNMLISR
jgi:hypothetical protein